MAGAGVLVAPVLPKFFDLGAAWQKHDLIWSIQATIGQYSDYLNVSDAIFYESVVVPFYARQYSQQLGFLKTLAAADNGAILTHGA